MMTARELVQSRYSMTVFDLYLQCRCHRVARSDQGALPASVSANRGTGFGSYHRQGNAHQLFIGDAKSIAQFLDNILISLDLG